MRLTFHGEQAKLPIISKIVKEDEVDLTIIEGNIKKTQEGAIGSLYVQLMGQPEKINQAIENLRKMRVEVEVITDVK